jgi:DNA-binding MarR family transcriptional regulator
MANRIGLQKSSFSKYVKLLIDKGLVERYQQTDNIKDIILKPTEKGRNRYQERSRLIFESAWKEPFAILDKLTDENLAIITEFMSKMVADLEPKNNKVRKLLKLQ